LSAIPFGQVNDNLTILRMDEKLSAMRYKSIHGIFLLSLGEMGNFSIEYF
jgi:hypothetical protein